MTARLLDVAARLKLDRVFYRLSHFTPGGLRRWYRHHRFDRARGVDTRGYGDPRYEPTPAETFATIVDGLTSEHGIDLETFTFIDIGSGKGKVLLLAAAYPFRRVVGVERFEDLHAIAERNLAGVAGVELVCEDAARYDFPAEPSIVYLFNPFSEAILNEVVRNLERSLAEHPRPQYVVYYAPILKRRSPWDRRRAFDASRALQPVWDSRSVTVYRAVTE